MFAHNVVSATRVEVEQTLESVTSFEVDIASNIGKVCSPIQHQKMESMQANARRESK